MSAERRGAGGVAGRWALVPYLLAACDGADAAQATRRGPGAAANAAAPARTDARDTTPAPCAGPWVASAARHVDARGVVAGSVLGPDRRERPVVWDGGVVRDLGLPPGATHAAAVALTAGGGVVVNAWRRSTHPAEPRADERAYVWRAGRWTPVDALPGAARVYAVGANGRGAVVGHYRDTAGVYHAFLWRGTGRGATVVASGVAPGSPVSANALNDSEVVAGVADPDGPYAPAFVWRAGARTFLFRQPPARWSTVNGISAAGAVVGGVRLEGSDGVQPFVYQPNAQSSGLGPGRREADRKAASRPARGRDARAGGALAGTVAAPGQPGEYTAVSPAGVRVGHADGRRAFVSTDSGTRPLAPVPGFDEARPTAVNDGGMVAGTASLPDPTHPGYVPGPGTRAVIWDGPGTEPRLLPLPTCATPPAGR